MEQQAKQGAGTAAAATPPARILVVDDEKVIRTLLERCLASQGYHVVGAGDGPAALALVAAGGIDLVLLDINMPTMDGFAILGELRRTHGPGALPVIMVSASGRGEDILRAIHAEATDYIAKPIDADALLWRVQTHLARSRTELALRESEERFGLALRASNQGLWDWNRDTGAIYFSPHWKSLVGYGDDEGPASFDEWCALVHAEDRAAFEAAIDGYVRGAVPQLDVEYRIRRRAGDYRWVRTRARSTTSPGAGRIVGSLSDVNDRKLVDATTGLPNRVQFQDGLAAALRAERPFAAALINIDRFRLVNEGLGSAAGDALLQRFAERFRAALPAEHLIARLGGDQFGLLAREIDSDAAMGELIAACRRPFDAPVTIGDDALRVAFRVGAVIAKPEHHVPGDLLHDADRALRTAKLQPEGRVAFAERPSRGAALAQLKLENEIHRALARDEFIAVYHPIVALANGRTVGFEALARWQHPERGLMPPAVFIGVAEETGLIAAIDGCVLAAACREAVQWPGAPFVSVNVSGYRFGDAALVDGIDATLAQSGLDPRNLKLEITESTIMTDASATARTVKAIAERGIGVSIDDFGTGYSSLAYLHNFDASTLKIDRSFVTAMAKSEQGLEIVRTIIMLARTLDMTVVAEGIETLAQYETLRSLGCEYGQGYYFAKPLSATDARQRLDAEAATFKEAV